MQATVYHLIPERAMLRTEKEVAYVWKRSITRIRQTNRNFRQRYSGRTENMIPLPFINFAGNSQYMSKQNDMGVSHIFLHYKRRCFLTMHYSTAASPAVLDLKEKTAGGQRE